MTPAETLKSVSHVESGEVHGSSGNAATQDLAKSSLRFCTFVVFSRNSHKNAEIKEALI